MSQKTLQHLVPFDDLALNRWENEGGSALGGAQPRYADDAGASASWDHGRERSLASRNASRKAGKKACRTKRGAKTVKAFGPRFAGAGT